ncbi:MAG: glycosyltransferase family 2 protein [Candidatus Aenigmatarchaeota archaeon]|nr:glycosyltransferase family 2 protein [Candidatus Aenigmarchaeota archaeon]
MYYSKNLPELSIVIPTYNEKENIVTLIDKLFSIFSLNRIKGEIIIVDDNSPDGTGLLVERLRKKYRYLKIIHRKEKMGLSSAILAGFKIAKGNILGAMDADMSHPPEAIPIMLNEIKNGADFVIGSRYIKGGKIIGWPFYRKLISKGATFLAKIFTKVRDPMSGFFLIKSKCLEGRNINPKGFKICLELLVKANYKSVKEVPITFTDRQLGKSKLNLKEYYYYLSNLGSYMLYKKIIKKFVKFCIVGAFGTLLNIAVLYVLTEKLYIFYMISAVFAFVVALTSNFILNKIWTFGEKLSERTLYKYSKFFIISILALFVNLIVLYILVEYFQIWYIFSQVLAILISSIVNFFGNAIWTFKGDKK